MTMTIRQRERRDNTSRKKLARRKKAEKGQKTVTLSTTDPDSGVLHKGDHKRCFAYEATRHRCTRSKASQKTVTRHIWKDYEELADDARYTPDYQDLYVLRKQAIERVFADAREKHAMRYTQYRGLAQASKWVRLKFAAMNLKKLALWKWREPAAITR